MVANEEPPFTVQCPRCNKSWILRPDDLHIRGCESGGIYAIELKCPHCGYEQDLKE